MHSEQTQSKMELSKTPSKSASCMPPNKLAFTDPLPSRRRARALKSLHVEDGRSVATPLGNGLVKIALGRHPNEEFGFRVAEDADGAYVSAVTPDGLADGRLQVGDRLVKINDRDMAKRTLEYVKNLVYKMVFIRMVLIVQRDASVEASDTDVPGKRVALEEDPTSEAASLEEDPMLDDADEPSPVDDPANTIEPPASDDVQSASSDETQMLATPSVGKMIREELEDVYETPMSTVRSTSPMSEEYPMLDDDEELEDVYETPMSTVRSTSPVSEEVSAEQRMVLSFRSESDTSEQPQVEHATKSRGGKGSPVGLIIFTLGTATLVGMIGYSIYRYVDSGVKR